MTTTLSSLDHAPAHSGRATRWVVICILALILATSFQIRVRGAGETLEGTIDLQVLLELGIYGVVGAFALSKVLMVRAAPPRAVVVATGLHFAILAFSLLYSPVPMFGVVRLGQTTCVLLLVCAIAQRGDRLSMDAAMHGFLVIAIVATAGGAVSGYHEPRHPGRFTFWNLHPNKAAFILAIAVVIVAAHLWDRNAGGRVRWRPGSYWLTLVVLLVALVATESRTLMLAGLAGVIVVGWHSAARRVDVAVVGALSLAPLVLLGLSSLESYAYRGQTAAEVGSLSSRTGLWETSMELIMQQPLLGHGYGASRNLFSHGFGEVGGAHNALLEIVLDAGLLAAVPFVVLLTASVRLAWKATRHGHSEGPMLLGILTLLIVRGLTEQGLGQLATSSTLWLLIVIAWLLNVDAQDRRRSRAMTERPGQQAHEELR